MRKLTRVAKKITTRRYRVVLSGRYEREYRVRTGTGQCLECDAGFSLQLPARKCKSRQALLRLEPTAWALWKGHAGGTPLSPQTPKSLWPFGAQ